jgi:glucuronokinase
VNDSTSRSKQAACHARAALAGNPSDMQGGAVLAIPVRALRTEVQLGDGPGPSGQPLIDAALRRVGVRGDAQWKTNIPRSVGLAGSSALVIAALRASGHAPDDPLELARLALSIERDDLGIAGGLQDRAVQSFDRPVLVDGDDARVLTPGAAFTFVVAWSRAAAADSGDYHRARDAADLSALADAARAAADAFEAGDAAALAAAMGESARLRDELAPLSPAHNACAERVRALGFTPNSTGSGGAVVALVLGELDEVAAGVVEHGDDDGSHLGRRLRELDPELGQSVVFRLQVVDGELGEGDAVLH